jgi:hypothetical protein
MALWSVYPFADASMWYAWGHPELRAWLELPGGRRLRVDVLHVEAPYEGSGVPALWDHETGAVREELAHEPRPLVIATLPGTTGTSRQSWLSGFGMPPLWLVRAGE